MVVSKMLCNIKDTRVNEARKRDVHGPGPCNKFRSRLFLDVKRVLIRGKQGQNFLRYNGYRTYSYRLIILLELFSNLQIFVLYSENIIHLKAKLSGGFRLYVESKNLTDFFYSSKFFRVFLTNVRGTSRRLSTPDVLFDRYSLFPANRRYFSSGKIHGETEEGKQKSWNTLRRVANANCRGPLTAGSKSLTASVRLSETTNLPSRESSRDVRDRERDKNKPRY